MPHQMVHVTRPTTEPRLLCAELQNIPNLPLCASGFKHFVVGWVFTKVTSLCNVEEECRSVILASVYQSIVCYNKTAI
jgi:hypothetical protein